MCIDFHQTGSVGKGSDHLQLIKYWPSCAPGKGSAAGEKIFGSALQRPARSVCVSLSAFFHLKSYQTQIWTQSQITQYSDYDQNKNVITMRALKVYNSLNSRR